MEMKFSQVPKHKKSDRRIFIGFQGYINGQKFENTPPPPHQIVSGGFKAGFEEI